MAKKTSKKKHGILFIDEDEIIEMLADMSIDVDKLKKEGKLDAIIEKILSMMRDAIILTEFADITVYQMLSRATERVSCDEGLINEDEC